MRRAGPPGVRRTDRLIRAVVDLRGADLGPATLRHARLCLLDALGNMVAASDLPEARAVGRVSESSGPGPATIVGWDQRTTPIRAAFHNAVHADLLESQDGHREAGLHPGEAVIPAGLALAEARDCTIGELLTAMVAGYEVSVRAAEALFPEQTGRGFYPDGTTGPLGGAVCACRLLQMDAAATRQAVAAVAFAAPISLVQSMRSPAKPLLAGMAVELGLRGALWAREGLGGDSESFAPPHGFFDQLAMHPHLQRLEARRHHRWAIDEVYLKPYPGGRHAHAPSDALREILSARPTDPRTVESVRVRTYRAAISLTGSLPNRRSPLAELTQSTRYVLAATVADGTLGPERFRPERRADASILALARRVTLEEDPRATRAYPRTTRAEVTLVFSDGRRRTQQVRHRWGDPERPMTVTEVRAKFLRSLASRIPSGPGGRLWDRWWNARRTERVRGLIAELSEAVGPARGRAFGAGKQRQATGANGRRR